MNHKTHVYISGERVNVIVNYHMINDKVVLGRTFREDGEELKTENWKDTFLKELR